MLTTFAREDWKEPPDIDAQIDRLKDTNPTPEALRVLFPYRGIARRRLVPYGIPEGAVLQYVRAKHEPSLYPFVSVIGVAGETQWGNYPRRLILNSDELQLVEA